MSLIKLAAFKSNAGRDALHQAAGTMEGGFLGSNARVGQKLLDKQFTAVDKVHELRSKLHGMTPEMKAVHGAGIEQQIREHLSAGKSARGAFQAHTGFNPATTLAAKKHAADVATESAAHATSSAPSNAASMLGKVKDFAVKNPGKALGIGAGVAALGYGLHKLTQPKKQPALGYYPQG